MTCLFNFLKQAFNVWVPSIQLVIYSLFLFKTDNSFKSVNLSYKRFIVNHICYFVLTSVNPHSHQFSESLELNSWVIPRNYSQIMLNDHFEESTQMHWMVLCWRSESKIITHFLSCFILIESHQLRWQKSIHVFLQNLVFLKFSVVLCVNDVK